MGKNSSYKCNTLELYFNINERARPGEKEKHSCKFITKARGNKSFFSQVGPRLHFSGEGNVTNQ